MDSKLLELFMKNNLLDRNDIKDNSFSINYRGHDLDLEHILNIYKIRLINAQKERSKNLSKFKFLVDSLQSELTHETKTKLVRFKNEWKNLIVFINSDFSKVLGYLEVDEE